MRTVEELDPDPTGPRELHGQRQLGKTLVVGYLKAGQLKLFLLFSTEKKTFVSLFGWKNFHFVCQKLEFVHEGTNVVVG